MVRLFLTGSEGGNKDEVILYKLALELILEKFSLIKINSILVISYN